MNKPMAEEAEQMLSRTKRRWEDPKVKRLVAQAIESARSTDPRVFPVICNIIKELNADMNSASAMDTARALLFLALNDKAWIEKYKESYDAIFAWIDIDRDSYPWPVKQMGGISLKSTVSKIKAEQRRKRVNELLRNPEARRKVAMGIESARTDSLSRFNAHTPLEQAPCRVGVALENISRALDEDMATARKILLGVLQDETWIQEYKDSYNVFTEWLRVSEDYEHQKVESEKKKELKRQKELEKARIGPSFWRAFGRVLAKIGGFLLGFIIGYKATRALLRGGKKK